MKTIHTIYKITNIVNNKIYVGMTKSLKTRWRDHVRTALNNYGPEYMYPLKVDIREFGVDNFRVDVICKCVGEEVGIEVEAYFINKYQSYMSNYGYNICAKGTVEHSPMTKIKFYKFSLDGGFLKEYDSITNAIRDGVDEDNPYSKVSAVLKAAKRGGIAYGFRWSKSMEVNIKKRQVHKVDPENLLKYFLWDVEGNLVVESATRPELMDFLGITSLNTFYGAVSGNRQTLKGYVITKTREFKPPEYKPKPTEFLMKRKPLRVLNADGSLYGDFPSRQDFLQHLGLEVTKNRLSNMSKYINSTSDRRKYFRGFILKTIN